jgi:glycerol-3-phosphate dehydrogenase
MGVPMPIAETCYRICYENYPVNAAVTELMTRPGGKETD